MTAEGIKLLASRSEYELVTLESPTLILPRKFLFYQCMDFESVPRALRKNLLAQRVRQFSPFNNPASWQVSEGKSALVWFWDSERVVRMHHEQDLPTLSVVPETMLYPALEKGLRLQPCIEGWELQYWVNKLLLHSRWFANKPDAREQADFVRVCGATEDEYWIEGSAELLSKPWNEKAFWSKENLQSEAVAPRLVLGIFLAWFCLQLGLGLGVQIKKAFLSASVATKNHRLADVVKQRDGALQQQEFNQSVSALVDAPSQLHLVAQVRSCLASLDKFMILDWQYQRGQIAVVLQQDNLDTRALIEACNKNPLFTDVRAEPGITPNQSRLVFSLPNAVKEANDAQ
ncbi:hypothetical protein GCM10011613_29160 [Cellvibrio zantedeschiae]|uniref:GspL cytoplasmic actin-ATPase-like domain-containing protein n=2 Tax=Cellvibrio zantedeschiae TaxID=1237077 RepID=A0ABQ3BA72_9GAMM|nr:hypothetical protein GCM10011613_29160 [Cellvibrio zantedeschiae]